MKKSSELDHKVSMGHARHASRKCCLEIRAQKQVVSGQSVKSNVIFVAFERSNLLLPMLDGIVIQ